MGVRAERDADGLERPTGVRGFLAERVQFGKLDVLESLSRTERPTAITGRNQSQRNIQVSVYA